MKKVKGKAGQGNTFWDSYQRIAVKQGLPSQNRTRRVCLYECITYLLFFLSTAIPLLRRHGRGYSSTTPSASQRKILFKSTRKIISVAVVKKNILAIQTPGDDMINRTGDIESSVSRHATMIGISQININ